jgi:hypothetical protein
MTFITYVEFHCTMQHAKYLSGINHSGCNSSHPNSEQWFYLAIKSLFGINNYLSINDLKYDKYSYLKVRLIITYNRWIIIGPILSVGWMPFLKD